MRTYKKECLTRLQQKTFHLNNSSFNTYNANSTKKNTFIHPCEVVFIWFSFARHFHPVCIRRSITHIHLTIIGSHISE